MAGADLDLLLVSGYQRAHAYPIGARDVPHEEIVTAYCGIETHAAEIHQDTEADWVRGDTCMSCWFELAERLGRR